MNNENNVIFSGNKVVETYIKMTIILTTDTLENIKKYFAENNYLCGYLNCNYKDNLYPIHYIFSNHDLDINMIEYFLNKNCKLSYEDEINPIISYLFNNFGLSNNKVLSILEYLKLKDYDFLKTYENENNIYHYLSSSIYINTDIYNFFLQIHRNYDELNTFMETPLLLATRNNNTEYSLLLIKNGCDINKTNHNNNTALMYACMNNNGILITKLLEYGAELNYADNQNDICFFYACGCDNKAYPDLNLVKLLYMKGADIHKTSDENFSVLHYAAGCLTKRASIDTIIYLIRIGVKTDIFDINGKTFIDYLIKYEDSNVINKFLEFINLSIPLKNSLIVNEFNTDLIKIKETKLNKNIICNICHTDLEEGDKYYMCKYNHCFDNEYLLEWYKESQKNVCPLCFELIDLSCLYHIIPNNNI